MWLSALISTGPPHVPTLQPRPSAQVTDVITVLPAPAWASAWQSVLAPAPVQLTPTGSFEPLMVIVEYVRLVLSKPRNVVQAVHCAVPVTPFTKASLYTTSGTHLPAAHVDCCGGPAHVSPSLPAAQVPEAPQ